jgi:hypothetical protein
MSRSIHALNLGGGGSTSVTSSAVIADNAVVRGDGGARGIQGSGVFIDDSGNMQIAAAASALPANHTLRIGESSRPATDVNIGGGNATITSGLGTGVGISSTIVFQTPTLAAAGSNVQTLTTRLTITVDAVTADVPIVANAGVTKRVATAGDDATAVINVATTDVYELTDIANATLFSTTGTPLDGQTILIRFKDAGVAKALTWDAIFVPIGITLPAITTAGKWTYVAGAYNLAALAFHMMGTQTEA